MSFNIVDYLMSMDFDHLDQSVKHVETVCRTLFQHNTKYLPIWKQWAKYQNILTQGNEIEFDIMWYHVFI